MLRALLLICRAASGDPRRQVHSFSPRAVASPGRNAHPGALVLSSANTSSFNQSAALRAFCSDAFDANRFGDPTRLSPLGASSGVVLTVDAATDARNGKRVVLKRAAFPVAAAHLANDLLPVLLNASGPHVLSADACFDGGAGSYVAVFEKMEGSLLQLLESKDGQRDPRLNYRRRACFAFRAVHQTLAGLATIHAKGIVNQDLHAGNLLMTREKKRYKIACVGLRAGVPRERDLQAAGRRDGNRARVGARAAHASERRQERGPCVPVFALLCGIRSGTQAKAIQGLDPGAEPRVRRCRGRGAAGRAGPRAFDPPRRRPAAPAPSPSGQWRRPTSAGKNLRGPVERVEFIRHAPRRRTSRRRLKSARSSRSTGATRRRERTSYSPRCWTCAGTGGRRARGSRASSAA